MMYGVIQNTIWFTILFGYFGPIYWNNKSVGYTAITDPTIYGSSDLFVHLGLGLLLVSQLPSVVLNLMH